MKLLTVVASVVLLNAGAALAGEVATGAPAPASASPEVLLLPQSPIPPKDEALAAPDALGKSMPAASGSGCHHQSRQVYLTN